MISFHVGKALWMTEESFPQKVLLIVSKIPKGKVLTYGQVATLAGVPRAARIVGGVLYNNGPDEKLPWQRVINAGGKLSTYRVGMGEKQRKLLEREGLDFNKLDAVDLKTHQWWPSERLVKKFQLSDETAFHISQRIGFF